MVADFLFKSSDHEFLTSHQVSVSRQDQYQRAHSENGKMTESKTEKKNYVGKRKQWKRQAIVDRRTQRQFPPKYIENPFRLSKILISSLPRHIIITTVRSSTGQLEQLFDRNYKGFNIIFFEKFEIFYDSFSITISYPKTLIPFIWRKPVSYRRATFPAERKKELTPTSLRACSNCLALAMRALY